MALHSPSPLTVALGVLLVTSGAAFGQTFGAQLQWQQRDAVSATVTDIDLTESAAGDHRLTVEIVVNNPLERPIRTLGISLLTFEGNPPPARADRLNDPRSGTIERATVPAGESVTVTAHVDVKEGDLDRARSALRNGTVNSRASVTLQLASKEFTTDAE